MHGVRIRKTWKKWIQDGEKELKAVSMRNCK